jgi:hypothetical protein
MQLIGMLDSPYVRRVAIALIIAKTPFIHRPISLFRHIDQFSKLNPLLKAPTLLTDDGVALMDSSLILDYLGRRRADAVESAPTPGSVAGDGPRPDGHGKSGAAPLRASAAPSRKAARTMGRPGHGSIECGFERNGRRTARVGMDQRRIRPCRHYRRLRLRFHPRASGRRRGDQPLSQSRRVLRPRRSASTVSRRSA